MITISKERLSSPARLFTAFGTFVYVDIASGELRHGPTEQVPANVVFKLEAD
jgi:hypothetical protein